MRKVGFIGFGIMRRLMCKNMLKSGISLIVADLRPEPVEELQDLRAKAAASYREMAESCEMLMILPNAGISAEVINKIKPYLAPGKIAVDMSSVTPAGSRLNNESLDEMEASFMDAPVSGGEDGAVAGALAIMYRGNSEAVEALEPVFKAIGSSRLLIGGSGAGSTCKFANQSIVNISLCAVGEGSE